MRKKESYPIVCQVCGSKKGNFKSYYRRGKVPYDRQPDEEIHLLDDEYYVYGCSSECHSALEKELWEDWRWKSWLMSNPVTQPVADYNNLVPRFGAENVKIKGKRNARSKRP